MKNIFSKPDRIKGQGHNLFAMHRYHKPIPNTYSGNFQLPENSSWHLTEVPNNLVVCVTEKYKIWC